MQKFFCLFILLLAGALSAAGTAPRLNEFGALELDGTSWLVTFVNKSWTAFSYDGRWRDAVFHRREGGTDSAAFRVTIPDFPAGELKLALLVDEILDVMNISKDQIQNKNDLKLDNLYIKAEIYNENTIINLLNLDKLLQDKRLCID